MNLPRAFLAVALAGVATAGIAQVPNAEPAATGWIMGHVVFRGQHKGQTYQMQASVISPGQPRNPGASAAFGVDDAGQVMFIGNTEYEPTQVRTTVRRLFGTPRPPMTTEQAPRYLMVCSWPLDDERKIAGPLSVAYAERDDASARISKDGNLQESFSLHWVPIPAARASEKFAKADYCEDFAKTKKVSVPTWLLPRDEQ